MVRGTARVRIGTGTVGPGSALWVEGTVIDEPAPAEQAAELAREYRGLAATILQKRGAWQFVDALQRITDPSALSDSAGLRRLPVAGAAPAAGDHRPRAAAGAADRLGPRRTWPSWTSPRRSSNDVREGMEKQQREFLLRQQLAAIRKELAELDGEPASEEEDYRARIEAADLPEKVREAALKEAAKLERGSDQSPEAGWIRTWLDTVLEVPWNERTEDAYDITGARACWTPTTPAWMTSRTGSSSTSPCASGAPTGA